MYVFQKFALVILRFSGCAFKFRCYYAFAHPLRPVAGEVPPGGGAGQPGHARPAPAVPLPPDPEHPAGRPRRRRAAADGPLVCPRPVFGLRECWTFAPPPWGKLSFFLPGTWRLPPQIHNNENALQVFFLSAGVGILQLFPLCPADPVGDNFLNCLGPTDGWDPRPNRPWVGTGPQPLFLLFSKHLWLKSAASWEVSLPCPPRG